MEPMLGAYWTKKLASLFLDDILTAKRIPPGSVNVRPWGKEVLICFMRIGNEDSAERYRVNERGNTIWVPGDSWFSCHYHPKDYDGHAKQGKDLRARVVTMILAHDFKLKRENVRASPTDELCTDYFSEYMRKT